LIDPPNQTNGCYLRNPREFTAQNQNDRFFSPFPPSSVRGNGIVIFMFMDPSQLPDLFERLRRSNDVSQPQLNQQFGLDSVSGYSQLVEPPTPFERGIPTLAKGIYKTPSEMLKRRFQYAASWKDATLGLRFLSTREMENIWTNETALKWIQIRRETWPDSPPATIEWRELALFAFDPVDGNEVYLVWEPSGVYPPSDEPEVVEFIGWDSNHFRSIGDFVLYHCQ
jgi:hypothetical protein